MTTVTHTLQRYAIERVLREIADRHSKPFRHVDELRRRGLDFFAAVYVARGVVEDGVPHWFCSECDFSTAMSPFDDTTDAEFAFSYEIAKHLDAHAAGEIEEPAYRCSQCRKAEPGVKTVDEGLGSYEYFGAPGFDYRPRRATVCCEADPVNARGEVVEVER